MILAPASFSYTSEKTRLSRMLLSSAALVTASDSSRISSSKRCNVLFALSSARSTYSFAFVSVSMALISTSVSTRGFFVTLSRVSESSTPPDETCNFGAISWLEGLDDDGVTQLCTFGYCVIGQFLICTLVSLLVMFQPLDKHTVKPVFGDANQTLEESMWKVARASQVCDNKTVRTTTH